MLEMAASSSRWRAGLMRATSATFGSATFSVRSGFSAILAGIILGLVRVGDSRLIIVRQFNAAILAYPVRHPLGYPSFAELHTSGIWRPNHLVHLHLEANRQGI